MQAKTKRNEELWKDRQAGMSFNELGKKYGITGQTAWGINKWVEKFWLEQIRQSNENN